jgi:hypothetical protein
MSLSTGAALVVAGAFGARTTRGGTARGARADGWAIVLAAAVSAGVPDVVGSGVGDVVAAGAVEVAGVAGATGVATVAVMSGWMAGSTGAGRSRPESAKAPPPTPRTTASTAIHARGLRGAGAWDGTADTGSFVSAATLLGRVTTEELGGGGGGSEST